MAKFRIEGGNKLAGEVKTIGNKNAVLKMIPAALLTSETVTLTGVPDISDVDVMLTIMGELGAVINYDKQNQALTINCAEVNTSEINAEHATKLRASNMFIGPLLARLGEVTNVFPGGDQIGPREMNAHFDGLTQLGARMKIHDDNSFTLKGELKGAHVFLYEPSVTATENVLLASVLANGKTVIENAACEPHVKELCHMLNKMGAKIEGIGSNLLTIEGVESLHGTEFKVPGDHIFVGTMIVLAAITGGEVKITDVNFDDLKTILYFFEKLGVDIERDGDNLIVPSHQKMQIEDAVWARTKGIYSQPWPCFPTDLMSLAIILGTQVEGTTLFFEKMYSGRMFFANFLNGMGANIIMADQHRIVVNGKTKLKGHGMKLDAPDLRAGMAYVAAGLCTEGETIVNHIEHIERGYPDIENMIRNLGGNIERIA